MPYSALPSPVEKTPVSLPKTKGTLTIVVLGASGDLAKKKTFPALSAVLNYHHKGSETRIIGYARTKMSTEEFHEHATKYFKQKDEKKLKEEKQAFQKISSYLNGSYDKTEDFKNLAKHLEEQEKEQKGVSDSNVHNRIFYLALPPSVYADVATKIKEELYSKDGYNRLVVEKPFGKDLQSSNELSDALNALWTEEEIYRIDHYLGKEMVKNIMVLRFANTIFSSTWNRNYIDNVQITFREPFGTEGRGGYFDEFGIIRDVMQNHLFQILTCVAMENPVSLQAEDVRDEKVKVARFVAPLTLEDIVIGQYIADGNKPGYKDDKGVPKDSITPTFAAAVLRIQNARWQGVPFILKCGKALNEQKAEIRIQFKDVPGCLYPSVSRNELVIRVQPDEAVYMKVMNKQPGLSSEPVISELDLTYKSRYSETYIPDAYESLLLDVIRGDHSNFVRADELAHAWKVFTPLLHQLEKEKIKPEDYKYGGRGPERADDLARQRGGFKRHEQDYSWTKPANTKL